MMMMIMVIIMMMVIMMKMMTAVDRRQETRGVDGERRGLQRSETSRSVGSLGGRSTTSTSLGGRAGTLTNLGGKTVVSGRNLRSSLSKSVESIEQVVVMVMVGVISVTHFHNRKLLQLQEKTHF